MSRKQKPTPQPWRSRIVGHGEEPADQLLANPKNWRVHPKQQQEALAAVLSEVGWVQDVIVNRTTGYVVDGHARVALAISRGEKVPVVYVDLTEEEEALILATIDPLSAMAGTNTELLKSLLDEASTSEPALQALMANMAENAGIIPPDFVPTGIDDQDRLDQKKPMTCPECGHEFTA